MKKAIKVMPLLGMLCILMQGQTQASAASAGVQTVITPTIHRSAVEAGVTLDLFRDTASVQPVEVDLVQAPMEEVPSYEILKEYDISNGNTTKTVLPYKSFGKGTKQAKLQNLCETNEVGLRVYDGRYTVAVGTYFNMQVGQYFDLELENGVIIPCIMGDEKDDEHTDDQGLFTVASGCMTEFVVERKYLPNRNSATYCYDNWDSPVTKVTVYNQFVDLN